MFICSADGGRRSLLVAAAALVASATPTLAQYAVTRFTIDGGGATVFGGAYTLTGTIGQTDAGVVSGGPADAHGGFWYATEACGSADLTTSGSSSGVPDGIVNLSDFSVYLSYWSLSDARADVTTSGACAFSQPDGNVDLSDFSCYLSEWSIGCP